MALILCNFLMKVTRGYSILCHFSGLFEESIFKNGLGYNILQLNR